MEFICVHMAGAGTGARALIREIRYAVVLVGLIVTVVITLVLPKVPVTQLLVGGALATIIITIAGQQSMS